MNKKDCEDVIDVYEAKLLELPQTERDSVHKIVELMRNLCDSTGKQGRIASGLFSFNILLEHLVDE